MKKEFITQQEHRQPLRSLYAWLKSLQSTVTVMQTGAHPDDETSRLLARLSLKDGMHVVYVNAVRGQGGQNALGPERGDALGQIRTEELIAAMRLIRADLAWLAESADDPIKDFGFSKSGEQTFERWGKTHSHRQMVKMVRLFRPDVLLPTFLDVPGQHGHHRAVTQLTQWAFDDATDPECFPDLQLPCWQSNALYLPAWGGGGGSYDDEEPPPNATHELSTGDFDAVYGGTYAQIGEWSRACHATQGMGQLLDEDDHPVPLYQLKTASGMSFTDDLTNGIPITLAELGQVSTSATGIELAQAAQQSADAALSSFPDSQQTLQHLCNLHQTLVALDDEIDQAHQHRIWLKLKQVAMAASEAAHLQVNFRLTPTMMTGGSPAEACLGWYNDPGLPVSNVSATLHTPKGIVADGLQITATDRRRQHLSGKLLPDADFTHEPMTGWHALSVPSDAVRATLSFTVGEVRFTRPVELDHPLTVKAVNTGSVSPSASVVHNDSEKALSVKLIMDNEGATQPTFNLPDNWLLNACPAASNKEWLFTVNLPDNTRPGRYDITVHTGGQPIQTVQSLGYTHIRPTCNLTPCQLSVAVVDTASLSDINIGWIDGGVDRAWYWARQLGARVTLMSDEQLLAGEFNTFDVVVAGVFAGLARPLNQAMPRITEWINNGGHYVSEYHRPIDNWDPHVSSPLYLQPGSPSIRWRVTQPDAPVNLLAPNCRLFTQPNDIQPEDFEGWKKERGLYFASDWHADYQPLLSMSDSGESPLEGALLHADIGSGSHVHCALNLFYQMDQLVPGAFRLFVNLLSPSRK